MRRRKVARGLSFKRRRRIFGIPVSTAILAAAAVFAVLAGIVLLIFHLLSGAPSKEPLPAETGQEISQEYSDPAENTPAYATAEELTAAADRIAAGTARPAGRRRRQEKGRGAFLALSVERRLETMMSLTPRRFPS